MTVFALVCSWTCIPCMLKKVSFITVMHGIDGIARFVNLCSSNMTGIVMSVYMCMLDV